MILVIDVGNTNITFGVYEGKKLVTTFRMMSKMLHTSDEYGMNIRQLLMFDGISKDQIEGDNCCQRCSQYHAFPGGRYYQISGNASAHCGSGNQDRHTNHYGKSQGNRT